MRRWRLGCLAAGGALTLSLGAVCVALVLMAHPGHMPGIASRDVEHLHPEFRSRITRVLSRLEQQGFAPEVRETWRDADRQAYYRRMGWSQTRRGFHTLMQADGSPGALAADIGHTGLSPARPQDREALATFYRALLAAAREEGLTTGATWSHRNPIWAAHDLGWDPGHVQPAHLSLADARRGIRAF